MQIERFDQRDLPRSPPALEPLLTIDRLLNFVERFPVQQALDMIFVRKPFNAVKPVLEDSLVQIVCHSDIKRAREAAHDVDVVRFLLMQHSGNRALRLRWPFTS